MLLKRNEFLTLGLRLAFCIQILAYFNEFYQQIHVCSSLTRHCDGNLRKTKRLFKVNTEHEVTLKYAISSC